MKQKPLREALTSALRSRRMTLAVGRYHRSDLNALNAAIGRAQVFVDCYPVASDDRVREWCCLNSADVRAIVPGNQPKVLDRLFGVEKQPAQ